MQDGFQTSFLSGGYWHITVKIRQRRSLNRYLFVVRLVWWGMGDTVSRVRGKVCVSERQRCVSVHFLRLQGLAYWRATGRRPGECSLACVISQGGDSAWDNRAHRVPTQKGNTTFGITLQSQGELLDWNASFSVLPRLAQWYSTDCFTESALLSAYEHSPLGMENRHKKLSMIVTTIVSMGLRTNYFAVKCVCVCVCGLATGSWSTTISPWASVKLWSQYALIYLSPLGYKVWVGDWQRGVGY